MPIWDAGSDYQRLPLRRVMLRRLRRVHSYLSQLLLHLNVGHAPIRQNTFVYNIVPNGSSRMKVFFDYVYRSRDETKVIDSRRDHAMTNRNNFHKADHTLSMYVRTSFHFLRTRGVSPNMACRPYPRRVDGHRVPQCMISSCMSCIGIPYAFHDARQLGRNVMDPR